MTVIVLPKRAFIVLAAFLLLLTGVIIFTASVAVPLPVGPSSSTSPTLQYGTGL